MAKSVAVWGKVVLYMFIGQYKYNLDGKGRIVIPQDYRCQLGKNVVINKGIENCISIYSMPEWEKQVEKVTSLNFTQKSNRLFNRYFLSSAFNKEIDSQGRINLDDCLIKHAGITKECVIIGAGNVIEIWSLENWNKMEEERDEQFESISEEIIF